MRRLVALCLLAVCLPAAAAPRPRFGWPLAGSPVVDRGFAAPRTAFGPGHRGVDLRAAVGTAVLSAGPGQVSYAGLLAGRGVVTVAHADGLRTTYEPVDPTVRAGQPVAQGTTLGHLTAGHASCRPGTTCLHWGLLRGGTYLDPLGLVVAQRVRLLPVDGRVQPGTGPTQPVAAASSPAGHEDSGPSVGAATGVGALVASAGLLLQRRRRSR